MNRYVLRLYIAGQSTRSERAVATLRQICEQQLRGQCEMAIIDVLERPELAESERILATPTLVRHSPPPLRRIIGDLSDADRVVLGLELAPRAAGEAASP